MTVIDKILNEWSFRCHDGIVDMNDPTKLSILNEILNEYNLEPLDEIKYSRFLSITDLKKPAKNTEDKTRGDTVKRFVKEQIPFTLIGNINKPLKFFNQEIENIFDEYNYDDLKNKKYIFKDYTDQIYNLKDIQKTKDFGGKTKGYSVQHEVLALNELNNQIKDILQKNNLTSITVIVGDKKYPNIIGAENQIGNVKSDFNLINSEGNPVVFISHKKEGGSKSFVRWGGFNFAYKEKNPEVLEFIENISLKVPDNEFKKTYSFSQKISSDLLKKRIVFGKEFGKEFGIYNVQIVTQGKVYLEEIENNLYKLSADKVWINGDVPTGNYEPVFNARYTSDNEKALGFDHCESFAVTIDSLPNTSVNFSSSQYKQSEEQPTLDNNIIDVPKEFRLNPKSKYVDKDWVNTQSTDIKKQFDTSKGSSITQNNKEYIPLSDNSIKKLKEDLIEEFTTFITELFNTGHFELRVGERGNVRNITNLNQIPLKDYDPKEVKEKLKENISAELKKRAETLLGKTLADSVAFDLGVKLLKPVLVVDNKVYPLRLFAISTKEVKDKNGNIEKVEVENYGTMYLATISNDKVTTLLLLEKEDDNELYFQIKKHKERKPGEYEKEAKILEFPDYIYKINLDELMGNKAEKEVTIIDPATLPYKVRTDYRVGAKFEHEKFGAGNIVGTSAGSGGKGDSRGVVDWVDVKYSKPFLKGGKLTDIRRFEKIYTLASPLLAK